MEMHKSNINSMWIMNHELFLMLQIHWIGLTAQLGVIFTSLRRRHVEQYYLVTRSDWWLCLCSLRGWWRGLMCDSGVDVTPCLCSPVSRDITWHHVTSCQVECHLQVEKLNGQRGEKANLNLFLTSNECLLTINFHLISLLIPCFSCFVMFTLEWVNVAC